MIDISKLTPLHTCNSKKEAEKYLEEFGASPKREGGVTPLHYNSSLEVVEYLIQRGANVNSQRCDGMTPLHVQSDPEITKCLLINGADPNITDKYGMTPLHGALNIKQITLLLEWGADCNICDEDGDLPENCYDEESVEMINMVKSWREKKVKERF